MYNYRIHRNDCNRCLREAYWLPSSYTLIQSPELLPSTFWRQFIRTAFNWYNSTRLSLVIKTLFARGDCERYWKKTPPNWMRILGDLILNNLLTTLDGPFTKPSTRAGWSDWIWIRIKSSRRENEVVSIDSIVSKTSRNTVHNVITALRMMMMIYSRTKSHV